MLQTHSPVPTLPESVRALIGVRRTRQCLVTARDIKRFAQAIGEPTSAEDDAGPLVAPPLFCQTMTFDDLPIEALPADGSPAELDLPLSARRVVGGGSDYVINRRVRAGETITVVSRLKDVIPRHGKSGLLYLLIVETGFTDQQGCPVATEIATYIKRP